MKDRNFQFKQRGVFSVEFALIGVVFSALLAFSSATIIDLSTKGKLDRLSFSLVNIIKERTQLYPNTNVPTREELGAEVGALYTIAGNSLARTMGSFDTNLLGIQVEQQTFDANNSPNGLITISPGTGCNVIIPLNQLILLPQFTQLSVISSWGRRVALYRVTLCYGTITSSSVMIGR